MEAALLFNGWQCQYTGCIMINNHMILIGFILRSGLLESVSNSDINNLDEILQSTSVMLVTWRSFH